MREIRWYRVEEVITDFLDSKGFGYAAVHTPQCLGPATHQVVAGRNRFSMVYPDKNGKDVEMDITDSVLGYVPLPQWEI